ncbi:hypothetical protein M8C21_015136 [Ambrosia artemisiifolia]|uniref:Uncharacterized protein n=1 Tax=Ambrosia artemisiifolia TaxID=4212 RepID=A0AAD5C9R2_AMBAR|nr:hypothetical protein M8C21_015136 [Ambrosia artemisiifolia]
MGDAAVSALVNEVVGRLTPVAIQEFGLLWGFKNDILTLKNDFTNIQAVLQDAEEKHFREKEVELWLKSLRSASLMVENVLDDVSTAALLQRLHKKRGLKYKVRAFFSLDHNQLMYRVRIAHKVKVIRRNLDAIKTKRFELGLTPGAISHVVMDVVGEMPHRETSSLIHDSSIIYGRNEEMEMLTEKICDKDIGKYENGEIRVHGIWGMGGMGKTTLAQLVYNHQRVDQYFELRCWVYISENFQVKEAMKKIIESSDKCGCTLTQLETLQESLQSKLRGKKFLIVLDDVWIEDDENGKNMWEELRKTLSCGEEESIVLMTTRSQTTCQMFAKVPELQHNLECLSDEDSWLLFEKLAFAEGREGDTISELKPIGMEIVEKCKGMPLALKTLGSLMWSKRSISDWQHVKDNNIWELDEIKVLPAILKLSYDNLAPHSKRCFAYCCLFLKGYELKKDVVIRLWVSNGFITPRGETNLYVIAEEIFNCLVWRSFFQVIKGNKYFGEIDMYKMHDLMHDMAQHVMRHDCLIMEPGKDVIIPNEVLHLSSSYPNFLFSSKDLGKLTSLRSIFMFNEEYECSIKQNFNHEYLRVLYLCGIGLKTLPESICKLKHLKDLNLSNSRIEVLPESIIYLQNLQVLLLHSCRYVHKLPEGLRYLGNLQCLDIRGCDSLLHLPVGIKELTSLRRLPKFPVGKKIGAKIGELKNLNLLEGKLSISRLENVGGLSEAKSANLKCKTNLSVLDLRWSNISKEESRLEMFACDEKVLEGLEPNMCLKGLQIFYYMGKVISPSWMANLRNLVEIEFFHCNKCEYIPPLGRLPNLRVIGLWGMDSLKCFHDNNTNMFPCLEVLNISYCPRLVSLPSNFPKLKVLELKHCMELVSLPDEIQTFIDLNELFIYNCKHLSERYEKELGVDWPKISHIPRITIVLPR